MGTWGWDSDSMLLLRAEESNCHVILHRNYGNVKSFTDDSKSLKIVLHTDFTASSALGSMQRGRKDSPTDFFFSFV